MKIKLSQSNGGRISGAAGGIRRSKPQPMALEPRYMFDGAAVATGAETVAPEPAASDGGHYDNSPASDVAGESGPAILQTEAPVRREVVFVDTSIANWEALVADTRSGVEVVLLDAARDAFEQMAEYLAGKSGLDAVHLVSHGGEGELIVGGAAYRAQSLEQHASALAVIGRSLSADGDILLYGCDVGRGSSGAALIEAIARATDADVAASTDTTGAALWGGNWTFERQAGEITAALFAPLESLEQFDGKLATISLTGNTGWTAIMFGAGKDPQGDSQAGAADTDIIGDASHGSLYTAFDDNGSAAADDNTLLFRLRIDNPTSATNFAGVAIVGIDANLDGKIDIFIAVDGRNNGQAIRLLDPGTGANISPSTTSTAALPTGWLPNNGVYAFTAQNYSVSAVSNLNDPHWNGNNNLGTGGQDVFISWRIPIADLATVLAKASPVDRNGIHGPRGATGIAGYTQNTVVQYVSFTQTQTGPINGDLNGVGSSYDKNATFAELGTFTAPMSASSPVPASTSLTITDNVPGTANGAVTFTFSFSEGVSGFDASDINVAGGSKGTFTAVNASTYTLLVTPNAGIDNGAINVSVNAGAGQSIAGALPTAAGNAIQAYDTLAPSITVDTPASALSGTPILSGTSDLPNGSLITVTVDPDNNAATANLIYQVMVSGGAWTLNTATVAPISGSMPSGGLTSYTKVTATATDAAGNSSTATELNRPTVKPVSTNDTTPVINGTWTNIPGDVLTVTVNGATYTLAPAGNSWSLDLGSATPSSGTLSALAAGNAYEVTATVTRAATSVSDTSSSELTITNTPVTVIDITGNATANGTSIRPVIGGTSSNAGGFVIVRLDPNNDGNLSDAVTYSVTPASDGSWTLDTATAMPISGIVPAGGFAGVTGIVATDSSGKVSDTQVLTVSSPTVAIGGITSAAAANGLAQVSNAGGGAGYLNVTEDDSVTISGTANGASTVDLVIRDANGHVMAVSGVAVTGGNWSVGGLNLSSLDNGTLTVTATVSGTSITATDTSVVHDKLAPRIFVTNPSEIKKNGGVIYGGSELPNTLLTVTVRDSGDTTTAWTGTVTTAANGDWSVTTSGNLVSGASGTVLIKVQPTSTAADAAGNIAQQVTKSQFVAANATTNTISIATIAGDDVITAGEIAGGVVISGTTSLTGAPAISVAVTDGTTTINLSATAASGAWNVTLTNAQIKMLGNGPLSVTATAIDSGITITDIALPSLSLPSPTLAISDNVAGTASGDVTYTFTFSEGVTGFDASDINVTGATKGVFTMLSATAYTLVVTPTAASAGNIQVSVVDSIATGANTGRGNIGGNATQAFNTTGAAAAPTVTIDIDNLASNVMPVISGSTSLSAGAPVVISIDTDNDGNIDLTYSAIVQSGGGWSVDTGSATPVSGSLPAEGLPRHARVVATATNAYGNSTSAVGQNTPTVTSNVTNDNTPTVSGSWTNVAGDTLNVVVNGITYSVANGNLAVGATSWSLNAGTLADNTYNVTATVSRGGTDRTDTTASELTVDTVASVDITGGATIAGNNPMPIISGTTSGIPVGTVLTLSVDTDNNGSYDLVYKTTVLAGGLWSVNTASAIPFSGLLPAQGLSAATPMRATATDPAGNTGTDTQILNVDVIAPAIALTFNAKTADATPLIMGTTDLPAGSTITVEIDPNNDGDWSDKHTYSATVQAGGTWSVEATTTLSGTVGVRASGTDAVGNSTTSLVKPLQIVSTAPGIEITAPIPSVGVDNIADAAEDDAIVLAGATANVAAGSMVTVTVTDGNITITDTVQVQANGSWSLAALNLSAMANGPISVTAEVADSDGSIYRSTTSFSHDKSAIVAIDSISEDTGTPGDFVTRDNSISISGVATANAAVTVVLKNSANAIVATFNVTSTAGGIWSTPVSGLLAVGSYSIEATVGATMVSKALTIVDASAPTLSSSNPADNTIGTAVANDLVLNFSKNIQAGSGFFSLYKNDGTLIENFNAATGKGDAGGTIVFNGAAGVTLNPNADLLTATGYYLKIGSSAVLDNAGNTYAGISNATTLNFTTAGGVDADPPAAPGLALLAGSDTGASNSDRNTSDDTPTLRVTLNGSGVNAPIAGDIVRLYEGATQVASVTLVNVDIIAGYVDVTTSTLGVGGVKALTATVTDAANNTSAGSAPLSLTLDTIAPAITSAAVNGNTLVLTYADANNLDATNIAATGAFSVNVSGNSVVVANVVVNAAAKTVTLTLASSVVAGQTVTVSYVDPTAGNDAGATQDLAGNDAVSLTNQSVTNNTLATTPTQTAVITAITDDVGAITGVVAPGGRTDDIAPAVSGTLSAGLVTGEVVRVYRNGVAIGNATVTGTTWAYADNGLVNDTTYSYTVRVENGVLQGASSAAYGISADTVAAAPMVVLTSDTGGSDRDSITGNAALTVSGTEPGATVQYSTDGISWTTAAPPPAEGGNTVYVRQIDQAGNLSPASGALRYTLDTIAPIVDSVAIDGSTLILAYVENGSGVAGIVPDLASFGVTRNGNEIAVTGVVVNAAARTVTLSLGSPVAAGDAVTLSYRGGPGKLQDIAGNPAASFTNRPAINQTAPIVVPRVIDTPTLIDIPAAPPAANPELLIETPLPAIDTGAVQVPGSVIANDPLAPAVNALVSEPISVRGGAALDVSSPEIRIGLAASTSDFNNVLTSRGENAFQIAVAPASEPNLSRFRGIPDQEFAINGAIALQVPVDAFVHTDAKAVVQLSARMANGDPIPAWLTFDAVTGKFSGEPPPGFADELVIVVEARDADGRRADAMFRIKLLAKRAVAGTLDGRLSLSEQIKMAGRRSDGFEHGLLERQPKKAA